MWMFLIDGPVYTLAENVGNRIGEYIQIAWFPSSSLEMDKAKNENWKGARTPLSALHKVVLPW